MNGFCIDSDAKIDHVHLKVSDLESSVQFYESFLRFKIVKKTSNIVLFSPDGNSPALISISESKSKNYQRMAGLYHFAILLPQRKDLANFLSHLLHHKDKVKIDGFSDHLVSEAIYIRDPDNIGIEIYRDRKKSEWEWKNNKVRMTLDPLDVAGLQNEATQSWNGFPAGTMLGHVHLHVSSREQAEKFYSEILGFKNTASMKGALFFAAGDYHHHVATNTWIENVSQAEDFPGLGYFSIKFSNKEKLDQVVHQLNSNKITCEELKDNSNSFQIFDDDKIPIRLTC